MTKRAVITKNESITVIVAKDGMSGNVTTNRQGKSLKIRLMKDIGDSVIMIIDTIKLE